MLELCVGYWDLVVLNGSLACCLFDLGACELVALPCYCSNVAPLNFGAAR